MSRTFTREDLAGAAREAVGGTITHVEAREIVDQMLEEIVRSALDGRPEREPIKISRFGTFIPWKSPARLGRNPKRPEERHPITARWRLLFRPSKELLSRMNPGRSPGRSVSGRDFR